jgi:hypothetical protein
MDARAFYAICAACVDRKAAHGSNRAPRHLQSQQTVFRAGLGRRHPPKSLPLSVPNRKGGDAPRFARRKVVYGRGRVAIHSLSAHSAPPNRWGCANGYGSLSGTVAPPCPRASAPCRNQDTRASAASLHRAPPGRRSLEAGRHDPESKAGAPGNSNLITVLNPVLSAGSMPTRRTIEFPPLY